MERHGIDDGNHINCQISSLSRLTTADRSVSKITDRIRDLLARGKRCLVRVVAGSKGMASLLRYFAQRRKVTFSVTHSDNFCQSWVVVPV